MLRFGSAFALPIVVFVATVSKSHGEDSIRSENPSPSVITAPGGSPPWIHFPAEDLGRSRSYTGITQDREGRLYVAANNRLFVGTGTHWDPLAGIPEGIVHHLHLSATGLLYVALEHDFGYLDLEASEASWVSIRHNLPHEWSLGPRWKVVQEGASGTVYIATGRHVFAHHPEISLQSWTDVGSVEHLLLHADGVFAFTQDRLVYRFDENGRYGRVNLEGWSGIGEVFTSVSLDSRIFLLGTEQGFVRFDGRRLSPFLLSGMGGGWKPQRIWEYRPDAYLALDRVAGLVAFRQDGTILRHLPAVAGIPFRAAQSAFLDREGWLWLAHSSGLYRVQLTNPAQVFDRHAGIHGSVRVLIEHEGQFFAGTEQGLHVWRHATERERGIFELLESSPPPHTLVSTEHGLAAGTDRGIWIIDQRGGYQVAGGERRNLMRSSRQPELLFSPVKAGVDVFHHDGSRWVPDPRFGSLKGDGESAVIDPNGYLWIGQGPGRLARYDPAHPQKAPLVFDPQAGLPVAPSIRGASFGSDFLFIGNDSFFAFNEERSVFSPAADWIPGQQTIIPDAPAIEGANGQRWIRTSPGRSTFSTFPPAGFAEALTSVDLDPDTVIATQYIDRTGNLWLGTEQALLRVSSEAGTATPGFPRQTFIHRAGVFSGAAESFSSAKGEHLVHLGTIDIGRRPLRFAFSMLDLKPQGPIEFATWLQGYQSDWQPYAREAVREFTALPPGDYRLLVKARNQRGEEASPAMATFTITAPFHSTGWAYLLYGLSAGGTVLLLAAVIHRRLLAANRKLHHDVRRLEADHHEQSVELASKHQQLAVALSRAEEIAAIADESKERHDRFTIELSHALRPAVAGIQSLLQLAREPTSSSRHPIILRALGTIGSNLSTTLREFLDPRQLAADSPPEKEPLNLHDLIPECFAAVATTAAARAIDLVYEIAPDVNPHRTGDRRRLTQILVHVLAKAIEDSLAGEIVITVRRNPGQPVDHVEFDLFDHGPGFSPQELTELLVSTDPERPIGYRRTTDDLTVARHLLGSISGTLHVKSTPGEGNHFVVDVHLPHAETPIAEVPLLTDRRVLIVDDNPHVLKSLQRLAEGWKMDAHIAYDGPQANESLKETPPTELVWMDATLGSERGIEWLANLRKNPSHASLPVVIFAHDLLGTELDEVAADEHVVVISKPLRQNFLHDASAALLGLDTDELSIVENNPVEKFPTGAEPAASESRTGDPKAAPAAEATEAFPHVLIADAHPVRGRLLAAQLRESGCRTQHAATAHAAVAAAEREDFALVFLTPHPTKLNILEVAEQIQRNRDGVHPVLIALASEMPPGGRNAGIDDCLNLPLSMATLERVLRLLPPAERTDSVEPDR